VAAVSTATLVVGVLIARVSLDNMSLAIVPLFKRFGSVIITVYTLAPLALSPKLLQFELCVLESFNRWLLHTIGRVLSR
jgi:hypothetical protein